MTKPFAIQIHAGVGVPPKASLTSEREALYREELQKAVKIGWDILHEGGTSLDAAERAVIELENCPLFNAGRGAVFTSEGRIELDASIMSGKNLEAGATAGITRVKNPISLARKIMQDSQHVFMIAAGAEKFALENGLEMVDPTYFFTDERFSQLMKIKEAEEAEKISGTADQNAKKFYRHSKFGTVGAVALDQHGNVASATSTGGLTNKRYGRVGDTPVVGAGTYANNKTCAVSTTGDGEHFMRLVLAHQVSCLIEYKNLSLEKACSLAIHELLTPIGGEGGMIGINAKGELASSFNTEGMFRAQIDSQGKLVVNIY